jgi:hypothetical protein
MSKPAVVYRPQQWLPRAKARAQSVLLLTEDAPPCVWGFKYRRYHRRTIEMLDGLDEIGSNEPGHGMWITASVRLEATCKELGVHRLTHPKGE